MESTSTTVRVLQYLERLASQQPGDDEHGGPIAKKAGQCSGCPYTYSRCSDYLLLLSNS